MENTFITLHNFLNTFNIDSNKFLSLYKTKKRLTINENKKIAYVNRIYYNSIYQEGIPEKGTSLIFHKLLLKLQELGFSVQITEHQLMYQIKIKYPNNLLQTKLF